MLFQTRTGKPGRGVVAGAGTGVVAGLAGAAKTWAAASSSAATIGKAGREFMNGHFHPVRRGLQIAFLFPSFPSMRPLHLFLLLPLALATLGMTRKPPVTVRWHVEANGRDGQPFAVPVVYHYPERKGFMASIPAISERNVQAIFPYPAGDGTFGCAFRLDNFGRTALEEMTLSNRGASVVAFVATKTGTHQVVDMTIDTVIRDGIITIPRGLTEIEVRTLAKEFKVLGLPKKK